MSNEEENKLSEISGMSYGKFLGYMLKKSDETDKKDAEARDNRAKIDQSES
jgi:hypothetical protein